MVNTFLSAPPTSRVGRYPKHVFNVSESVYTARPFMIAPVLPGETLSSMYMESRVITDPIANPIIGWKKEYFFFYVKMSDLLNDAIKAMFVDPTNTDLSATLGIAADNAPLFTAKGGVPWVQYCLQRIMLHYFRDAGEAWNVRMIGEHPVLQIKDRYWMDSLTDESQMPEGANIASATDAGDLDRLMNAFETLRAMGLAQMSYEDFLRQHGITVKDPTEGKPELLWHIADFQYPSNTVDPGTGTPTSAVSWVFKESQRERKFFTEPGFVFGISATRPKLYLGGQFGNISAHMSRAWDWMPALLQADMPETRLKYFAAGTGPLGDRSGTGSGTESEYWVDMVDVFIHGDQFLEGPVGAHDGPSHRVFVPNWGGGEDIMDVKYPATAIINGVFKNTSFAKVRQDGFVSLAIKGKQVDLTQANFESQ